MEADALMESIISEQIEMFSMQKADFIRSVNFAQSEGVFMQETIKIKRISNPDILPSFIFASGKRESLDKFRIGIVGTRKPDEYAIKSLASIIKGYRGREVSTVSGFAEGIDTIVHKLSLENKIETIAVLPGGFAVDYPVSNYQLRKKLPQNGLFLSEYSPYIKPRKITFIQRNLLIAAISDILLIIQGSEKSGTLSTLSWALKLKKQVFALPGEITNRLSYAPNYAIFRGAVPIYSKSILPGIAKIKENSNEHFLTEDERTVFELAKRHRNVADVLNLSDMSRGIVLTALTTLELKGMIAKGFNNKISILED